MCFWVHRATLQQSVIRITSYFIQAEILRLPYVVNSGDGSLVVKYSLLFVAFASKRKRKLLNRVHHIFCFDRINGGMLAGVELDIDRTRTVTAQFRLLDHLVHCP